MNVLINIGLTLVLFMSLFWALLPGGFGLHNFNKAHSQPLISVATATWWLLLLAHPLVFYKLWFSDVTVYWWLIIPLVLHALFFAIFGRDVST